MSKTTGLAALALLLSACQPQETPEQAQTRMGREADALKTAATGIAKRWEGWVSAGQADSIANVFTEDGREMPPNAPAVVGRAAIRKFEALNASMLASKLTIRGEAFTANGPLGVERGSYTFAAKARKGAPKGTPATVNEDGKYVTHWHNVNGQWLIAEVIWNANARMMPAAPAPKPAAHSSKKPTKKK